LISFILFIFVWDVDVFRQDLHLIGEDLHPGSLRLGYILYVLNIRIYDGHKLVVTL
jgi:hypothetical protein